MDGSNHDPATAAREWWTSVFAAPDPRAEPPETEEERRAKMATRAATLEAAVRANGYDPDRWRPDWNEVQSALIDCVYGRSRGVLLRGGTGCGKTTLLRALADTYRRNGVQYIDCIHAADHDWLDWPDAQRSLADNLLILLDDFGTDEPAMTFGQRHDRIARLIIDWAEWPHRYPTSRARLILATNLTGDQVEARYGERVMSRLRDLRPVVLLASDMRGWRRFQETVS